MVGFVSYNVENDKRLISAIDGAIKSLRDLRFPFGEISRDIFKNNTKNFILRGSGQYPPLSPAYAKRKRKIAPGAPILVLRGRLKDSVVGSPNSDSIVNIGKQSLIQGTSVPYAKFVQEGTSRMPGRKFLFIDDAQAGRFERILSDYVDSKLRVIGDVR